MTISRRFVILATAAALGGLASCKDPSATTASSAPVAQPAPAGPTVAAASALPVIGPAPAWKLRDIAGREVSSDEFKGKVVVVDFWATWCGPCKEEIPGYVELQKKHGDKGFVIVGVSLDQQGPPVVKRYADSAKINYPLVMGDDSVVAAFGGIDAIPTTFLIDREGRIRHKKVGAMETAEYEKLIAPLLE
jgi:thiol-disulfide isomerase/thioredoxin